MKRLALLLFQASPSWATISCSNSDAIGAGSGGTGLSSFSTGMINVSVGDLIFAGSVNYTVCTDYSMLFTDSAGNTWIVSQTTFTVQSDMCLTTAYTVVTNASASDTITINFSPSDGAFTGIMAVRCTGTATSSVADQVSTGTATSATSVTSNSFTPGQANEISLAVVVNDTNRTFTAGSSPAYTLLTNSEFGGTNGVIEFLLNPATSSQTASASVNSSVNLGIAVSTFKAIAAAPPYVPKNVVNINGGEVAITGGQTSIK